MLGNVQSRNFNQVAFTGNKATLMKIFIDVNKNQIAQINRNNFLVTDPYLKRISQAGPFICVIRGGCCGAVKVLSSIVKLPWKMLKAAGESLKSDVKELGTYIRSESQLAGTTLKVQGHDKPAKILTEL